VVRAALVALLLCAGAVFAPAHAADGNLVVAALQLLEEHYAKPVDDVGLLNAAIGALRKSTGLDAGALPDIPDGTGASASLMFLDAFDRAVQSAAGSSTDLAYAATRAMLASLHDSHVNFYEPAAFLELQRNLAGQASYAGIGVFVRSIKTPDGKSVAFVAAPFPGGPAARAGLRRFDRILRVNGKDTSGMTAGKLAGVLRGPPGSSVAVTVKRATGRTVTVSIVRQAIQIPPVAASFIRPGVAYVRLLGFPSGTGGTLRTALRALASHAAISAMILDLRSNGGGLIREGRLVAGTLLPPGTVLGHTLERTHPPAELTSDGVPIVPADTPLIVLIDGGTASTAELLTAGLRDAHRGPLLGEKTEGALGVALRFPLPVGGMEITVSQVSGPRYEQIEGAGISPDLPVDLTVAAVTRGEDTQLEAALRSLERPRASIPRVPVRRCSTWRLLPDPTIPSLSCAAAGRWNL